MATNIVKTLRFSTQDNAPEYQINAVRLDGHTYQEISGRIAELESFDALRYMGALAAGATLPKAEKGDVYKVTSAGEIAGAKVEIGDMLICNTDGTPENTPANWDIIQANVDLEAILAHVHTGEIDFTRSDKELDHDVTPTEITVEGSFKNGAATVTGNHGHTASGSVTLTPAGANVETSITPEGTVSVDVSDSAKDGYTGITSKGSVNAADTKYVTDVTVADHAAHKHTVTGNVTISKGTGAANYTPEGTVAKSSDAVTDVTVANHEALKHTVTSVSEEGAFTPAGSVSVYDATAGGTVESHVHDVTATCETTTKTAAKIKAELDASNSEVLIIGVEDTDVTFVTDVDVDEVPKAPTFTGIDHSHTAEFTGTAVGGHTHTVTIADHAAMTHSVTATKGEHSHGFTGTGVHLAATHNLDTTSEAISAHAVTATVENAAHTHEFVGGTQYIGATFSGTPATHTHTFTGTENTHAVTVTVNDYTGNFSGTATGDVVLTNNTVLKSVAIGKHKIATVDSGTFTTGTGVQG